MASTSCSIRSAAPYSEPALRSLAWEGRHLVVGFAAGEIPEARRSTSCCSRAAPCSACSGAPGCGTTRSPTKRRSPTARWCAQGKLSCHIQKVYPLAETPQAIKALAERKAMGKLVVRL